MDYRESHLQRGKTYDEYLENEPLSAYMTRIESSLLQRIVPSLFATPPTYLDFACGTARITSVVAPMASTSYGVDISESMLEKAKIKCPNTEFIHRDITKEDFNIAPVEMITSFRFFGNAQDALRSEVLPKLNKLLQKDGYLLINNHRNPWCLHYALRRLTGGRKELDLSPAKLKRLLNENGFTIVKSYGIAAWIVRAALIKPKYFNSSIVRYLEPLSRLPGLHFISPDALIVAKKTRELNTP
jgi:SAM-dependent methyltransferase